MWLQMRLQMRLQMWLQTHAAIPRGELARVGSPHGDLTLGSPRHEQRAVGRDQRAPAILGRW